MPDSFSFCSFSFFVFYDAFAVTTHLRLPEYFLFVCLLLCFLSVQLQQALGCCSFTSAKLPSDRQTNRGGFPPTAIFFCFAYFAYQCVEHSLLHRLTFGETEPGTDRKKSGRHSVFLQLRYGLVFTRERLTNGWLGSAFPWARTSPAAPSRRGDG